MALYLSKSDAACMTYPKLEFSTTINLSGFFHPMVSRNQRTCLSCVPTRHGQSNFALSWTNYSSDTNTSAMLTTFFQHSATTMRKCPLTGAPTFSVASPSDETANNMSLTSPCLFTLKQCFTGSNISCRSQRKTLPITTKFLTMAKKYNLPSPLIAHTPWITLASSTYKNRRHSTLLWWCNPLQHYCFPWCSLSQTNKSDGYHRSKTCPVPQLMSHPRWFCSSHISKKHVP